MSENTPYLRGIIERTTEGDWCRAGGRVFVYRGSVPENICLCEQEGDAGYFYYYQPKHVELIEGFIDAHSARERVFDSCITHRSIDGEPLHECIQAERKAWAALVEYREARGVR